jgi:RHS repeat-associated protein
MAMGLTALALAAPSLGQTNSLAQTKRFIRGVADNPPTLQSFVIPLDFQKGVELDPMGDNLAKFPGGAPWFVQIATEQRYHFGLANFSGTPSIDYALTPFENPIAAFGSRAGGTPLFTNQTYRFGIHGGPLIQTGPQNPNAYAIWVKAYDKTTLGHLGTLFIILPRRDAPDPAEKARWDSYVNNGWVWPTPEYPATPFHGLSTKVEFVEGGISAAAWGVGTQSFFVPGEGTYQGYILSHTATDPNVYFVVEGYTFLPINTGGPSPTYYPMAGILSGPSVSPAPTTLYAVNFDDRPANRAVALDLPQFQAKPMPAEYSGKSAEELLNASQTVTQTVTGAPSTFLTLDHSTELRRHPILDALAGNLTGTLNTEQKACAIANFVRNEIELVDAVNYNDNGDIGDESINLGGMTRGALATYQEGQGSPSEQCALLLYLLRQAGISAAYMFPERNKLLMQDARLSQLLKFQVKGLVDNAGNPEAPANPAQPSLIPVNYPWVAAHVNGQWVHLFPWIKDMEIQEGRPLYDYLPAGYQNAHQWIDKYLNADPAILNLSDEDKSPANLFLKFISAKLAENHPGLSIDDLGMRYRLRPHYHSRLVDFPLPFQVTGTPETVENLGLRDRIFDMAKVKVYSVQTPSRFLETAEIPLIDFHNRKLLLRQTKVSATVHSFELTMAPFRPGTTGTGNFANTFSALVNKQSKLPNASQGAADLHLAIEITLKRHRKFHDSFANPTNRWSSYMGYLSESQIQETVKINKGDLAAICINVGRVSRRMLEVHAQEFWEMEQSAVTSPTTQDADVYQGTAAYLMGMSYYNRVDDFSQTNAELHKRHIVSNAAVGLSTLKAEYVSGALPSGNIRYVQPVVDMFYKDYGLIGNETVRPDSGNENAPGKKDYEAMLVASASAMEHEIIDTYFEQGDAISTVELLRLAKNNPATYPNGFYELTINNYLTHDAALTAHDAALWNQVKGYFTGATGKYVKAYVTSEPVTGSAGAYEGMGALIFDVNRWGALISKNLNGGAGSKFRNLDAFQNTNVANLNLRGGTLLGQTPSYTLRYDAPPTPAAPALSTGFAASWSVSSTSSLLNSGAYVGDLGLASRLTTFSANTGYSGGTGDLFRTSYSTGNLGSPSFFSVAQSTASAAGGWVYDPVNVQTGEYYNDTIDLVLHGPFPLTIRRNYASRNVEAHEFGAGWKLAYTPYIVISADGNLLYASEMDGSVIAYRKDAGNPNLFKPNSADNPSLMNVAEDGIGSLGNRLNNRIVRSTVSTNTFYTLTGADGSQRRFQLLSYPVPNTTPAITRQRPYLLEWKDAHGNFFTFTYGADNKLGSHGQVTRILSTNGNFIGFIHDTYGRIVEAYAGDGRRLYYYYDSDGDLIRVIRPDGSEMRYEYEHASQVVNGQTEFYSKHLLAREIKPGGRILKNVYNAAGEVIEQWATVGPDLTPVRNATFEYHAVVNPDKTRTGHTLVGDAFNRVTRHDYAGSLITKITDPAPFNYEFTQEWYAPGDTTPGAYPRSLKRRVDRRGLATDYTYDAGGNLNLVTVTGDITGDGVADVAVTDFDFNAQHLLTQKTDAVNNRQVFRYTDPSYPYLATEIEHFAGATSISLTKNEYDEVIDTVPNPDIAAYGLLEKQTRAFGTPDAALTTWTHNANGFITSRVRDTATTDPDITTTFAYNLRGELVEEKDALNRKIIYAYDGLGNRIWEERRNEAGALVSWNYAYFNANGEPEWTDGPRWGPEDYVWKIYDGAGRIKEEHRWRSIAKADGSGVDAPLGDALYSTTLSKHDAFGSLIEMRGPRGYLSTMAYDELGRLKQRRSYDGDSTAAPLLSQESLTHEPGDQVFEHTNPLGGVTKTFYTATGKKKRQENPDGSVLQWEYYLDGRLKREVFRNGSYVQHVYNDAARSQTKTLYSKTNAQLAQETCQYDRRANLVSRTDRENNVFTTVLDALDRVKSQTGPATTGTTAQQTTTFRYDNAGKVARELNGLNQETKTVTDIVGRVVSVEVFDGPSDAGGVLKRATAYAYSPDHHSVTATEGLGAIVTTTRTNTFGKPLIVDHGAGQRVINLYDLAANLVESRNEAGFVTKMTYDGLNRPRRTTQPDNTFTELIRDAMGNVLTRQMPGGLYRTALYDNAGRLQSEAMRSGSPTGPATRAYSYAYYPGASDFAGLLQTVTDPRGITATTQYDDFLRENSITAAGALPEHQVTTNFIYDRRSLLTSATRQFASGATGPAATVLRTRDGYGQVIEEEVRIGADTISRLRQTWDAAGRRASLGNLLTPQGTGAGGSRSFAYRPDGLMSQVTAASQNYVFNFDTAGLLTSRVNPHRTATIPSSGGRDARGRLKAVVTTVGAATPLSESLNWTADSRMDDYAATRTGAGTWNETRDYQYNSRRQLTSESFAPAAGQSATLDYQFDFGAAGIGVRTRAQVSGGFNVSATNPGGVNAHKRTVEESINAEPKSFVATGNAFGADSVRVFLGSTAIPQVTFPGWWDAVGNWSVPLRVPPGQYTVSGFALHPSGWQSPGAQHAFTVLGTAETATSGYDNQGLTSSRSFSVSGRAQTFTWDALGRVLKFSERNALGDGLDETYVTDALGRRLQATRQKFVANVANGPPVVIRSFYDPQVEALEIGLAVNGARTWLVRGPDLNERYGGLLGCGGLEAGINETSGAVTGVVSDAFGHVVARVSGSAVTWSSTRSLGYGPQPGSWSPPIEPGRNPLESFAWRGKYADGSGLICLHARYYDPTRGRFISPDPLGHSATADLYSAFAGNPIDNFDPDGCLSVDTARGGWAVSADLSAKAGWGSGSGLGFEDYRLSGLDGARAGLTFSLGVATGGTGGMATTAGRVAYAGMTTGGLSVATEATSAALTGKQITAQGLFNAGATDALIGASGAAVGDGLQLLGSRLTKGSSEVVPNRALRMPATDTTLAGTRTLGYTTPNGNVFLQPGLSRTEQVSTLRHESVHAFFSPQGSGPVATFRQNLGQWGYDNSQLLRFTEEAIAETYGSGSLLQGLRHPLVNGYGISGGGLLLEGGAVGAGLFGAGYLGYQIGGDE